MKSIAIAFVSLISVSIANAAEPLLLANDDWPPFILEGDEAGIAEQLVCEALARADRSCEVKIEDWEVVLEDARSGAIDGIVAAWRTPDREEFLLFSEPYLVNRIVAAVNASNPPDIQSAADLAGKKVALVAGYAYGDEIAAMNGDFLELPAQDALEAISFVLQGRADLALMDELAGMEALETNQITSVGLSKAVLATRELCFAVSTKNPQAEAIMQDFQRAYQAMLSDGTVNEILNIDWLATDFGHQGEFEVVLRNGANLDQLNHPSKSGSVYSMGSSRYEYDDEDGVDKSRVKYQVKGKTHSDLQSALNSAFGTELGCEHNEYSSQFDCTKLFKKPKN